MGKKETRSWRHLGKETDNLRRFLVRNATFCDLGGGKDIGGMFRPTGRKASVSLSKIESV
jgi:hypothetical protein